MRKHLVVAAHIETSGVDQRERLAAPIGIAIEPVAGHALHVLDDGDALAYKLVEQRRLAHIGSADDGDERSCVHMSSFAPQLYIIPLTK